MHIYDHFSPQELEILRARAERVARAANEDQQERALTMLMVMAGTETYALPIESVSAVYESVRIVPVPCVPPSVAGIANIRGHIVLALDLVALLGLPAEAPSETSALVTLADEELNAALRVSAIGSVEAVFASSIVPVPPNLALSQAAYIQGLLPSGISVLDLDAILHDPNLDTHHVQTISPNGGLS